MKHSYRTLLLIALLLLALPLAAQDDDDDEPTFDALVNLVGESVFSSYLVGPEGMTLYRFALDDALCVEQCLENWPPLTVESDDELTAAEGIPGVLGTYEREDGTLQVTYNDMPLYYWINDEEIGDTTGDLVNRVWFVVEPATIAVGGNDEFGKFLVGPQGMTLYVFIQDEQNSGISTCVDECAENWPPFTIGIDETPNPAREVPGSVGVIEREDGTLQMTYDGRPLYYFAEDENIGDANGQAANDVWFVYPPETVVVAATDDRDSWLASADGFSLYVFANDDPGVSNCVDECAANWPPLLVASNDVVYGTADIEGELSVITREDGSLQVAYNNMPLYFWIEDRAFGERTGDGVGGVWFLTEPGLTRNDVLNRLSE